jgi:hypothetical protein
VDDLSGYETAMSLLLRTHVEHTVTFGKKTNLVNILISVLIDSGTLVMNRTHRRDYRPLYDEGLIPDIGFTLLTPFTFAHALYVDRLVLHGFVQQPNTDDSEMQRLRTYATNFLGIQDTYVRNRIPREFLIENVELRNELKKAGYSEGRMSLGSRGRTFHYIYF